MIHYYSHVWLFEGAEGGKWLEEQQLELEKRRSQLEESAKVTKLESEDEEGRDLPPSSVVSSNSGTPLPEEIRDAKKARKK
jgi:hypothetical protein